MKSKFFSITILLALLLSSCGQATPPVIETDSINFETTIPTAEFTSPTTDSVTDQQTTNAPTTNSPTTTDAPATMPPIDTTGAGSEGRFEGDFLETREAC